MHLDRNRNFKSHIQHLETKIAKSVDILSKLRFLPKSILRLLHYALIHPHPFLCLASMGAAPSKYSDTNYCKL